MQLDMRLLRHLAEKGLLYLVPDPHSDLLLANYAPKAQYDNVWPEYPVLLDCRGTILQPDGTVYAKPFRKFFNVGERAGTSLEEVAALGTPEISHKRDGSMITLFPDPATGKPRFATRGSFTSAQAQAAAELWAIRYGTWLPPEVSVMTFVFEYTAPSNRIVVQYDLPELVLIGLIDDQTGREASYALIEGVAKTHRLPSVASEVSMDVLAQPRDNFEGYVLFWPEQQLRLKVKLEEYVRLHRIITGVSERAIWEVLRAGQDLDLFRSDMPDEFTTWVNETEAALWLAYRASEQRARRVLASVRDLPTRKDQALALADHGDRAVVFKMLDDKPYDDVIWKTLRPEAAAPFRVDES